MPRLLFAGVGDVHGHMHAMVRMLSQWEQQHGRALDFVLQVGDASQPRRRRDDGGPEQVSPAR